MRIPEYALVCRLEREQTRGSQQSNRWYSSRMMLFRDKEEIHTTVKAFDTFTPECLLEAVGRAVEPVTAAPQHSVRLLESAKMLVS